MTAHLRTAWIALTMAAALALAGCGGDSGTGDARTSCSSALTGAPIRVGFVNSDQGAFALPEVSAMARAAANCLNHDGGVNGHPLELDLCATDGTPAASTRCANQFVTHKVLAVLNGDDGGLDSALPIYQKAGLHLFGVTAPPAVSADPNSTIMTPPVAIATAANGPIFKLIGIRNAVVILPNFGPAVSQGFKGLQAVLAPYGVQISLSLVAPANPDVTAAVTAAKAKGADALIFSLSENDCTNAVRTAKSLGWSGVLWAGSCTQFLRQLGPQAAGVYTSSTLFPYSSRASAEKYDPRLESDFSQYEAVTKAAGLDQHLDSNYVAYGYSTVMTFADVLKGISGEITQASVNQALSTFRGREVLGTPLDCTAKLQPGGACGRYYIALQVQADGTQTLIGDKPIDLAALASTK
ncbi:ABC transporter substrate-binding protein [Cryptosporangium sp. NPDC051539]|uniref:ABC transporter substrate-binding protein n=1 Tax=Cryptosporangium sp. NPDC051539 TaxID=3363962 RepID=UPI0037A1E938